MISVTALQQNNKIIYVGLLSTLTVFLLNLGWACPQTNANINPRNKDTGGVTHRENGADTGI